ncbi:hypothetical protein P8452_56215 [Trifolium repens]|jgi:hypothetical protein|nr:hypothetical protein P8452_56215 [Trifolium repens]
MADHYSIQLKTPKATNITVATSGSPLFRNHVSNSTQLFGLLTLLIITTISLILTGLTLVIITVGVILLSPMIILLIPIWVPVFAVLFVFTVMFLSTCGFGIVVVAMLSWMLRYFRGLHRRHGLQSKWINGVH